MPPTADIATPDRFRPLRPSWLLVPMLLVATWSLAGSHHPGSHHPGHLPSLIGLAAVR